MLGNQMPTKNEEKSTEMNQKKPKVSRRQNSRSGISVSKLTETCFCRAGFQGLIQLSCAAVSSPAPKSGRELLAAIFLLGRDSSRPPPPPPPQQLRARPRRRPPRRGRAKTRLRRGCSARLRNRRHVVSPRLGGQVRAARRRGRGGGGKRNVGQSPAA